MTATVDSRQNDNAYSVLLNLSFTTQHVMFTHNSSHHWPPHNSLQSTVAGSTVNKTIKRHRNHHLLGLLRAEQHSAVKFRSGVNVRQQTELNSVTDRQTDTAE